MELYDRNVDSRPDLLPSHHMKQGVVCISERGKGNPTDCIRGRQCSHGSIHPLHTRILYTVLAFCEALLKVTENTLVHLGYSKAQFTFLSLPQGVATVKSFRYGW